MARRDPWAIPEGWEIETPAAEAAPTAEAPEAPATPVAGIPEGWEVEGGIRIAETLDKDGNAVRFEVPANATDQEIREAAARQFGADYSTSDVTKDLGKVGAGEAVWRGVEGGALMNFADEIRGVGGAVGNKIGNWLGMNESTADFGDIYETIRAREEARANQAWEDQPGSYALGYVPGMATGLALPGGRVAQGGNWLANTGRLAGAGAAYGGVSGAGAAGPDERISGAASGAALGAVAAPLVQPLTRVVGETAARLAEFGPRRRNNLNSGLDALSRRMPEEDLAAMSETSQRLQNAGVEPRLIDVIGEAGRGVVRSAMPRSGAARTEAARLADEAYVDAQDRVAGQARRIITDEPRTARQMSERIRQDREAFMTPAMQAVRNDPVPITPRMVEILSTPEGRRALNGAKSLMTDAADRRSVDAIISAARAAERQIDPRMPQRIQDQMRAQLFQDLPLTVDMADKFARSLNGRARLTPGLERVSRDFSNTIRDAAREASPGYSEALDAYASASRVADAGMGEGRFADNSDLLRTAPDVYRQRVTTAERTEPYVAPNQEPLPSERAMLEVRARDDIVDRATRGTGDAMRVARDLSVGSAQGDRNLALLGPRRAGQLRDSMGAEVERVRNTRYVDERVGSKTAGMMGDSNDQMVELGINAISGGKWGVVREASRWLRDAGVRGVDAERLTRDAMDPDRTEAAIQYLVNRGLDRDRARGLMRSIFANMIGRAAGTAQAPREEGEY